MPVKPIPDGYHAVTPYLVVKGAADAIEFYKQAFGASETMRLNGPGDAVMHAEFQIGDSRIRGRRLRCVGRATTIMNLGLQRLAQQKDARQTSTFSASAPSTCPLSLVPYPLPLLRGTDARPL